MNRIITACAGAMAFAAASGSGIAADIVAKAPLMTPGYNWSGFYVGGQVGYGWGSDPIALSGNAPLTTFFASGAFPTTIAPDPHGIVGGIEYGTNWQTGRFVYGFESDISAGDIRSNQIVSTAVAPFPYTHSGEEKLSWFGTTRVRGGMTLTDNLLAYATGGLASGRTDVTVNSVTAVCAAPSPCPQGSESKTRWGWTLGGGLEYGAGPWSAKVEYLHYDLGDTTFSYFDPIAPASVMTAQAKFSGDIVRAGVNYRFDWTPWQLLFGR